MLDYDEPVTQKRKQSPSVDDGGSKRLRIAENLEEGGNARSSHDVDNHHNRGAVANGKTQSSTDERRSEGRTSHSPRPNSRADGTASPRGGHSYPDRRQSSEAPRPPPSPPPRKNPSLEEKKRGQRLFGGLLSTLSQTTSNSQQKKRLEIERRQQERARQQQADDHRRKTEKLRKLDQRRKVEQVEFEEQAMRTRHANMLVLARSLRTTSLPRLYYRPWELTKEQERIIEDQVMAAKEMIDREVEDFEDEKVRRLRDLGVSRPPPRQQHTVGEPNNPPTDANRRALTSSSSKMQPVDKLGGDVVVYDEDTVLY